MPTVDELWRKHVKPELDRAAEREATRIARAAKRVRHGKPPAEEKESARGPRTSCEEHGHSSKGTWCVQTSASGKVMSKCFTCGQGFLLPLTHPHHPDYVPPASPAPFIL